MKNKQTKTPVPNPLTVTAIRGASHQHSIVVERKLALAQFQLGQANDAIERLTAALAAERQVRSDFLATIEGLNAVLVARGRA